MRCCVARSTCGGCVAARCARALTVGRSATRAGLLCRIARCGVAASGALLSVGAVAAMLLELAVFVSFNLRAAGVLTRRLALRCRLAALSSSGCLPVCASALVGGLLLGALGVVADGVVLSSCAVACCSAIAVFGGSTARSFALGHQGSVWLMLAVQRAFAFKLFACAGHGVALTCRLARRAKWFVFVVQCGPLLENLRRPLYSRMASMGISIQIFACL